MIKKINLFLIVLLLIKFEVSAQKTQKQLPVFKYGKVTPEEFDTKPKGADSAAAAVKLFDVGNGYFDIGPGGSFIYVFERHVRYKIINKKGYDLADLEIRLYRDGKGNEEKMDNINAATYNLNNGKIEVSKMAGDAKFTNYQDNKHIIKKYTLPNIKEGSIIEYRYKTKSDFIFKLDDWYFQGKYPTIYSSFCINIPDFYSYKFDAGGYYDINKLDAVENTQNMVITNAANKSETISVKTVKTQYYIENIPAIKNESYITTLDDYVSKIGFELNSTNFPGNGYKAYTSTWPKIIKEMMDHQNFGGFIQKKNPGKELIKEIIKDETSPEGKMNLIFNYVKNNIKWDNKYRVYTEASNPKAVIEKRSGSSSEINLLLLNLLDAAGLESYPVIISTRENGTHPGYPLASKFNSVIVMTIIDEKKHLLDAVDKNNTPDLLSYDNLNHRGLKMDRSTYDGQWISTDFTTPSRTSVFYNLTLAPENKFKGTLSISKNNYDGVERRNSYQAATSEEEFLKEYKRNKPGLEISNYKIENLNTPEQSLIENMDVTIDDNIEEAGNLSYFMPLLFERTKENPFTLEERNYPVDFAHPNEHNYHLSIEFPSDYKLDQLPKSEKFTLPDGGGSFTMLYTTEGNRLSMVSKISILKPIFTPEEYYNLKELYKNIIRKQAEQIVFKKI
ncbi:transglutaminase [Pedobacter lusitanus]|uniref:Transglutaminase n=1 Tax=Pedobacter lusitanus TaxID=1503925 RepID=A0A0D0F1I9_9SPHI|nr:transglutaminase domain-containing protein [Pedobacter lusitanus]KIO75513.1 transglutaminase [Pedobacter lusitanus]